MSNTNISITFFDTDYRYFYNNHQFDILYQWCFREERDGIKWLFHETNLNNFGNVF